MENKNLYNKHQIKGIFPHALDIFESRIKEEYDKVLNSKEFIEKRDEYIETEKYKKLVESHEKTLSFVNKVATPTYDYLKSVSEKEVTIYDLVHQIGNIAIEDIYFPTYGVLDYIQNKYDIKPWDETTFKIDDFIKYFEEFFEKNINKEKELYAISSLNLTKRLIRRGINELIFYLNNVSITSSSELENLIKTEIDYKKFIYINEDDEILSKCVNIEDYMDCEELPF